MRRTAASHDIFTPALTSLSVFFPFFKATSSLCFGERDRLTTNLRPPRHCLALYRFLQSGILPISCVIFSQAGDEWRSRRGVKLLKIFFFSRVQYMLARTIIHTNHTTLVSLLACSVNRQDDNLVPRVLSLFLEVGRERPLGTRLARWTNFCAAIGYPSAILPVRYYSLCPVRIICSFSI